MLLNNEWVINVQERNKKYLETNETEHRTTKNLRDTRKSCLEREVYSITGLPQKDTKISNKPFNTTLKRTKETTANKGQME